jgi:hypothetical protein
MAGMSVDDLHQRLRQSSLGFASLWNSPLVQVVNGHAERPGARRLVEI